MKKIVAFLAREHGLNALEALLKSRRYQVVAIATHRRNPLTEDPTRSTRVDFAVYKHLAAKRRIPLYTVDSAVEQKQLEKAVKEMEFDVIASVSWRRFIPSELIAQSTYGGVNLHRGRLPSYPGAEPIKQALMAGDGTIVISAHRLTDVIDGGELLKSVAYTISPALMALPFNERIAAIKQEITPYFGPLLLQALELACVEQENSRLLFNRR